MAKNARQVKYTTKKRQNAAKRGWDTRRTRMEDAVKLKQADYGINPGVQAASMPEGIDIGGELPVETLALFGGIAGWEDVVHSVDRDGYNVMHTCFPVMESVGKLGVRTAKLDWTVVGDGERADAFREIILQARNWTDMIEWLTWADVDGVRFMQIKSALARAGGDPWVVPDFWMGGRMKAKAGGSIQWDGADRLILEEESTGVATTQAKILDITQFIIHRPGGGSNPEGDLNKGLAIYRIARQWNEALKNTDAHMRLFGIPIRVFNMKLDGARPDQMQSALTNASNKIVAMRENKVLTVADENMLSLIEPKGKGFADLKEYSQYLEGLLDQLFLGNTLTSKTNEGGRTGNTETHKDEEDEMAFVNGIRIAEALNRHLIPWIVAKNPGLPELKEGEFEPYLWPQDPSDDDEQDIEIVDEVPDDDPDGSQGEPDPDPDIPDDDPDANTGHEDDPDDEE